MDTRPLILSGFVCPYCGKQTEFVDSSEIYGKSYGMVYLCRECDAYVGFYKGTDIALGRLANKQLRKDKNEAHFYFDKIFTTGIIHKLCPISLHGENRRNKAYRWLSEKMKIHMGFCHIGMFDIEECRKVVEICKPLIEQYNERTIGNKK